jgi:hypothetical protein
VARNLSGSCSTTARSQSSLQRSLVSPRKVSPPKRHLFAVHDFTILTNQRQQAAPPACSINSEDQDSRKQLGRQIISGRELVPPQLLGCDLFEVLSGEAQVKFAAPPCRFPSRFPTGHLGCQNPVAHILPTWIRIQDSPYFLAAQTLSIVNTRCICCDPSRRGLPADIWP